MFRARLWRPYRRVETRHHKNTIWGSGTKRLFQSTGRNVDRDEEVDESDHVGIYVVNCTSNRVNSDPKAVAIVMVRFYFRNT